MSVIKRHSPFGRSGGHICDQRTCTRCNWMGWSVWDWSVAAERFERYETEEDAPPEEWQPSPEDMEVLYNMRVAALPDHGGFLARYQKGSRFG